MHSELSAREARTGRVTRSLVRHRWTVVASAGVALATSLLGPAIAATAATGDATQRQTSVDAVCGGSPSSHRTLVAESPYYC